jgi:diguanylate cyclase (GGDEF)-like protein
MSDDGRIDQHGTAGTLPPTGEDISPQAQAAILRLMAEIDRLREEIAANNRRIAHLEEVADRDPLTPTVNRRAFVRELERTKAYVDRYKAPAAVIYFDIDGMKTINDRYGHAIGDEVLVVVARTLMGNVRSSDIVGRLGGDEFGIILSHAERAAAEEKAATLARLIADIRVGPEGEAIGVIATWGVETLVGAADARAALDAADRAMYARKRKGDGARRS